MTAVRLERRGRRHDLERRARRVEALCRAVDQRRRGAAVRGHRRDLVEVVLDEVRVVARRGGHHEHLPATGVERGHGAAVGAERVERDPLRVEVERRDDRVADDRLARELVELLVDEVGERALGPGQLAVQRLLQAGAAPRDRRIAHDRRRELALRVAAEVVRLAAAPLCAVPGEHPSRREDQPALHLELRHALDLVVLPCREPRPGQRLPVRRRRR